MIKYIPLLFENPLLKDLPVNILSEFLTHCKIKSFKSNKIVSDMSMADDNFYYILNGAVRGYYKYKGSQVNTFYFIKDDIFANVEFMFLNSPGELHFETIAPSSIIIFSKEFLLKQAQKHPEIQFISFKYLAATIVSQEKRLRIMLRNDAKERYLKFIELYGKYSNYLPLKEIAIFLDIAPETLSRIRKEIANSV
ncbi:MAG: Crp/Fnr family transcriptional regulator [Arachidicoccus sp.]|nr:Crp/Fnr family transcriptional regulator [Arachidicoccus sp.]